MDLGCALADYDICRLGRRCEYEISKASYLGLKMQASEIPLVPEVAALDSLKDAVIHQLQPLTPECILSTYKGSIEPWFPVAYSLQGRLSPTWSEVPLDVALLCLSISLVSTSPSSTSECHDTSLFTNAYLQIKSSLALAEGLGLNSLPVVQSR